MNLFFFLHLCSENILYWRKMTRFRLSSKYKVFVIFSDRTCRDEAAYITRRISSDHQFIYLRQRNLRLHRWQRLRAAGKSGVSIGNHRYVWQKFPTDLARNGLLFVILELTDCWMVVEFVLILLWLSSLYLVTCKTHENFSNWTYNINLSTVSIFNVTLFTEFTCRDLDRMHCCKKKKNT